MDKEDFYEDFINLNLIKTDELLKELHIAYLTRNALYRSLQQHEDAISSSGITFKTIVELVEGNISHSQPDLSKLDIGNTVKTKVIRIAISSLFYTATKRIPLLIKQIQYTQFLASISKRIYFELQEVINWNISNAILKGDYYNFGRGLGKISIKFAKRNFRKLVVDWGSSLKFKASLITRGLIPYSKDNNGSKWFIYHTDDDFCFWWWNKSGCNVKHYRYYTFRSIRTGNIGITDWCKGKTVPEILSIRNLGNFDRMLAIIKINPKHKELYQDAV